MPKLFLALLISVCFFSSATAVELAAPASRDWNQWRGPNRDGKSPEKGLLKKWPKAGPKLLWQGKGLGRGYSSVAFSKGRLFTMGHIQGSANLIAIDAANGQIIWKKPVGGGQPNCTPTVDGERVYALSRGGDLVCADVKNGKIVWRVNFRNDLGGRMMSGWGYSESPLVDGDRLIVTPGADDAAIAALNKKTGAVIWKTRMPKSKGAGYSSIVISQAAGVKQYVQLTGRGLIGVSAADGKLLWGYNKVANGTANIPTPIISGDYVFASSGYNTGAALLKISKRGREVVASEVYFLRHTVFQNHHGGMILIGKHVYTGHGHNKGFPLCIELMTGKVAWRPGRGPGGRSAAIAFADGHLYFRYENGTMALIEAKPSKYRLKGSFRLASVKGASWPHPCISDGRMFLRDQDVLMCYDLRK